MMPAGGIAPRIATVGAVRRSAMEEVASVTATAAVASATAMEEATASAMAAGSAARPRHRVTVAVSLEGSESGLLWSFWVVIVVIAPSKSNLAKAAPAV